MKIKVVSTGGTIDKVYFDRMSEYQVGEPMIKENKINLCEAY